MINELVLEKYLDALLKGNRQSARTIVEETLQKGIPANTVYSDLIWPIMVEIDTLARESRIVPTQENLAIRINRTIVDQLQNKLPRKATKDKKIVVCCAPSEAEELGAQIMADLFESDGWQVKFLGGGLNNDDILSYVNESAPDILLIYGTNPNQAPEIRQLIDTIRGVNAWSRMKTMVSGGIFNRVEDLWQEIGADLFAKTAFEALHEASKSSELIPSDRRTINRRKRRQEKVAAEKTVEV